MKGVSKVLAAVAGVSLLALTTAGKPGKGPKPKTEMYTIQGHVCSGDGYYNGADGKWYCVVDPENEDHSKEIGVTAPSWFPPEGTLALRVSGDVLCEGKDPTPCVSILPDETYQGRARLLDHRFDFEFDTPDRTPCKLIGWDTPFPLQEGDGYCRYGLIFVVERWNPDGTVVFSEFRFLDYTQGNSLTDPQIYRGGGLVPEWWDGVGVNPLTIQLLFPANEPNGGKPGKGPK